LNLLMKFVVTQNGLLGSAAQSSGQSTLWHRTSRYYEAASANGVSRDLFSS
jgi:hypothetical protein